MSCDQRLSVGRWPAAIRREYPFLAACLFFAGCVSPRSGLVDNAEGSDGGAGSPALDAGPEVSSLVHSIDGFEFPVKEGSWWEYTREYHSTFIFTTGSGTVNESSTFVLRLGAPTTIAGERAFPVEKMLLQSTMKGALVGSWQQFDQWPFVSFEGKRIRGSKDKKSYSVLFDANTGIWPVDNGNKGMFGTFQSRVGSRQARQKQGPSGTLWEVRENNSSMGCERIPGYPDAICTGGGNLDNGAYDTYDPAIGIVGSYSEGHTSDTSGSSQNKETYALIESSLAGDRPLPAAGNPGDGGVAVDAARLDGSSADGGGPPVGASDGPVACVSLPGPSTPTPILAANGAPPAASGGVLGDGLFRATAVHLYGLAAAPGSTVGTLSGLFRLQGATIEMSYTGMNVTPFYGKGTATPNGTGTISVSFSCSSGASMISYEYTVSSPTTVDIYTRDMGLTTVATYTKQ
jgi:hypothetical protein